MNARETAENDVRLRDLSDRIDRAIRSLADVRTDFEYGSEGYKRITAKIEGVALVGSYVDECLRVIPPEESAS